MWDVSSGSVLLTFTGHNGNVNSVDWSPDGNKIASASGYNPNGANDNTVRVSLIILDILLRKLMFKSPY